MSEIKKMETISQFNNERGQETLHPLVSVLDQSKSKMIKVEKTYSELYVIFLKDIKCEDMYYGRNKYDYQAESIIFIEPGQSFGIGTSEDTIIQPNGWALAFHPDFICGTSLGNKMHLYQFFGYHIHEALHLSKREIKLVLNCFKKIKFELKNTIDIHTTTLICSNIELLLNYCNRFYSRQFITRELVNKNVINQLDQVLYQYFESDHPQETGLPSVSYCADIFHLSPNYFGDLIKKESGRSAQEYIQQKIIDIAKHRLSTSNKPISEIAYDLGFKYPQHFTKLFKLKTGQAPSEYRKVD